MVFALLGFYENFGNFKTKLVSIEIFTHTHSFKREREEANQNIKPYIYM